MKQLKISFYHFLMPFVAIVFISFSACNPKKDNPAPLITGNVLIANEGAFGQNNGSISFFNPQQKTMTNDVFKQTNSIAVGGSVNSIFATTDKAFIIVQTSNAANDKVEIVSVKDLKTQASVTGKDANKMIIPRHCLVANNKLYVTNWGNYDASFNNPNAFVLVINLANNEITKRIEVPNGAEYLLLVGNEIWVSQSQSTAISVIDINNDTLKSNITVPTGPKQMQQDKNGKIWVTCNGTFSIPNKKIVCINASTKAIEAEIELKIDKQNLQGFLQTNPQKDSLYVVMAESFPSQVSNVYAFPITVGTDLTLTPLINKNSIYGFGIDPNDGTIYLGIAPNFSSAGTIVRFSKAGKELDNFAAGIAPKIFAFQ